MLMVVRCFPPLSHADESGLLAIGGDCEVESLLLAYRHGIFPWPFDDRILAWFSPPQRAVLFLDDFHVPQSLAKARKNSIWKFTIDRQFEKVIKECSKSKNRKPQRGTWITRTIVDGFIRFHRAGYAHSVECWDDDRLIGGLYGVSIGGMFAGESMFYLETNASKLCLCFLIDYLRERGVEWIDCQQLTPTFASFGAREIPREKFVALLDRALVKPAVF